LATALTTIKEEFLSFRLVCLHKLTDLIGIYVSRNFCFLISAVAGNVPVGVLEAVTAIMVLYAAVIFINDNENWLLFKKSNEFVNDNENDNKTMRMTITKR